MTEMALQMIEILMGVLALAFAGWAGVVWKASQNLSHKFDNMMHEFRKQAVDAEHRITMLEAEAAKILEILEEMKEER